MLRNLQATFPAKSFIIAAILISLFTSGNIVFAQQRSDNRSLPKPADWSNNEWYQFFESSVQIVLGEGYGAAGTRVNPVLGGKLPLVDVYSALSAIGGSTKAGLQLWLRRKMADAETAEDWKRADRYEAFYDCLTNSDCAEMRELTQLAVNKASGANSADVIVEVIDSDTGKRVPSASVRIEPIPATGEAFGDVTDDNGETMKLPIPVEKARNGLRAKVTAKGYMEKWSEIPADQLRGGERRITIYMKATLDARFFGTWSCKCNYSMTLNSDGTGVFTDSRGGPDGSMYASGSFKGKWSSSGNSASLSIGQEYKHRSGVFSLTLKDGKLSDQFGGVFTK